MNADSSDPEGGDGLTLVFLGTTLSRARQAEQVLDAHQMEFQVQVDVYGRTLFGSPRRGACFYVPLDEAADARAHLEQAGLGRWVIRREDVPA